MTHEEIDLVFPPEYMGNAQISDLRLILSRIMLLDSISGNDLSDHAKVQSEFELSEFAISGEQYIQSPDDNSTYGRSVALTDANLYIGDYGSKRVQIQDLKGNIVSEITNTRGGFGRMVDADGTYLVVGAHSSSTAWIYNADGTNERQIPTPSGVSQFGRAVAVKDNLVVITSMEASKAWLFTADTLDLIQEIDRPAGGGYDGFGKAVVIGFDKIVISDKFGDDDSGAVFVYDYEGNLLTSIMALNPLGGGYNYFGEDVAINSTKIIIGERQGTYEAGYSSSGLAWLVNHDGSNPQRIARMEGTGDIDYWAYGSSVALSEENWFVGGFECGDYGKVYYGKISEVLDGTKVQILEPQEPIGAANSFGVCCESTETHFATGRHYIDAVYLYSFGAEPYPDILFHPILGFVKNNKATLVLNKEGEQTLEFGNSSIDLATILPEKNGYEETDNYSRIGNTSLKIGTNLVSDGDDNYNIGERNRIDGYENNVYGRFNEINSYSSNAFGSYNTVSNRYSTALGWRNTINSERSMAFGYGLTCSSTYSTALGRYNTSGSNLMEVGMGSGSSYDYLYRYRNALEIGFNGSASLPAANVGSQNTNTSLITKEIFEASNTQTEDSVLKTIVSSSNHYGGGISMNDQIIAVGAIADDTVGLDMGAVLVYNKNYDLQFTLYPTGPLPEDDFHFGEQVVVTNNRIVVLGRTYKDSVSTKGRLYIFDLSGNLILRKEYIRPVQSVDVTDTHVVIAVYRETTNSIMDIDGNVIQDFNTTATDREVALNATHIFIGDDESVSCYDLTGTFVFAFDLPEIGHYMAYTGFGTTLALIGDKLLIGAPNWYQYSGTQKNGQAYLYNIDGTYIDKIESLNGIYKGNFAQNILSFGDTFVLTAGAEPGTLYFLDENAKYLGKRTTTGQTGFYADTSTVITTTADTIRVCSGLGAVLATQDYADAEKDILTLKPNDGTSSVTNSFFVDSADGLLKFKDNSGTIRIVNLT